MENFSKKFICFVLLLTILLPFGVEARGDVYIGAWGAIAIDGDTGEVLYSKNPDKWLVPASITKVMTTYIIFEEMEAGRLTKDSLITVSDHVARISRNRNYPMAVPLGRGESYSVDQFIKLIMIPSASASCIAVAEHISGTEAKFVERMNETARNMGIDANFKNSHGAKPHYTTPRALAILIKNFIDEYPDILNYTSMQGINFNGRRYNILNKLMHSMRYEGVDGFKTGTISEARYCLSSTGKKDNRRVIAVVLGSQSNNGRYTDSKKVLDFAFDKLKEKDLARKNTHIDILNLPDEIRGNIQQEAKIKFSNVDGRFSQNGKFYVDGKLVKEIRDNYIEDGFEIEIPFIYEPDGSAKGEIEIRYDMEIPKDKPNSGVKQVKISQLKPGLYKDLDNKLYEDLESRLEKLDEQNIMGGIGRGYFGFDLNTSRGDFITILGRLTDLKGLGEIYEKEATYDDVSSDDYFNNYVVWASENSLIQGHKNKFMPKKDLTLEEIAKILDSYLIRYDLKIENTSESLDMDNEKLSIWSEEAIDNLLSTDILSSLGSGTMDPKAGIKRRDLVDIIFNLETVIDRNLDIEEKVEDL